MTIDSIARHASKVKGRYRHNDIKEAILLIKRRRSDICDNICSDCSKICSDICNDICNDIVNCSEVCGEVCGEVWAMSQKLKKYGYFSFKYSLESL